MKMIFKHRFVSAIGAAIAAALLMLLIRGEIDIIAPVVALVAMLILGSVPAFLERTWQSKYLPPNTIHVPMETIRNGNDYLLLKLFDLPQIYQLIRSRYQLRSSDAGS